jgi:N-acetylglucosamine kinase-like BadF-type ATPase
MILIADSGSTKTDWCLIDKNEVVLRVQTKGMNPYFQSEEEIVEEITKTLSPQLPKKPLSALYFYGAGCAFDKIELMRKALERSICVEGEIEVNSDMLGTARALCGREAGIACILGTGSNSCYYDGKNIVANVSPLGFILGDEGSGAVLGKLFIGSLLKNQLTEGLKETFLDEYKLTPAEIIDRVYRKPFPNRFLATFSPFIAKHIEDNSIQSLVKNAFSDFFRRNVMQYDYRTCKVHFCGSIAHFYRDLLIEAANELQLNIGTIAQTPMDGLVAYHSITLSNTTSNVKAE